jgi:hypothetical protein
VYLPPGYRVEPRCYLLPYMLRGGGNKDEWPAYGLVNDVDQPIVAKVIKPLIVVMPLLLPSSRSTQARHRSASTST